MAFSRKIHWDRIYQSMQPGQVSWTQNIPETSMSMIRKFNLLKSSAIIDIGGGDSKLVDCLLDEGYEDITVLDISGEAIQRAKQRLGKRADVVKWMIGDITEFEPTRTYSCWHDRAAFHFLTEPAEIKKYLEIARKAITGYLVLSTFSDKGPRRCSELDVCQYAESELTEQFQNGFDKICCLREDHITPFQTKQNFLYCSFRRQSVATD
ncbi:MAG: class I SAM-dependent methyltransferase [Bacteroidia bacterium]|nr:class I SAM-dependent methyltransferase [Bacteroidia bacterium]